MRQMASTAQETFTYKADCHFSEVCAATEYVSAEKIINAALQYSEK